MTDMASPIEFAAITAAVGWPFAAGLGVVLWSKHRAAARERKLAALDAGLRTGFDALAAQAVPERLALVVEALEEAQAMREAAARGAPRGTVPV